MTWDDVHLDEQQPYVVVRASTSKNRKPAQIPLHSDVIETLREIRPNKPEPNAKVFPPMYRMWHFKGDLKRAGIEYCDAMGRYADFHSLRHTANTNLARAGVGERVRMAFMRHSDMKLTSVRYTDATQLPVADGVNKLPSFSGAHVHHVHGHVHTSGLSSPSQSTTVKEGSAEKKQDGDDKPHDDIGNKGVSHGESQSVASGPSAAEKGKGTTTGSAGPCLKRTILFPRPSWRSPFQDGGLSPISFIRSSVQAIILSSL